MAKAKKGTTAKQQAIAKSGKAADFYKECLVNMNRLGVPYVIGGTYALSVYTGIFRQTKDIDFFVRAGDYPKILAAFAKKGFKTVVDDERWIAKIYQGRYFVDLIFNSGNVINPVTDEWFRNTKKGTIMDVEVPLLPPTEFVWSKMFVTNRTRYDGNDVAHMILKANADIDWKKLLTYADQYWEVLLIHLLNFRFIYPSERDIVPKWLMKELLGRAEDQMELSPSRMKVCRGRMFSWEDFAVDVSEWGFADVVGDQGDSKKDS